MHHKAQTSFETIFIAAAIIMLATICFGYVSSIRNSTVAMDIAKTNTLKALNQNSDPEKNFIIKKIDFTENIAANSIELNIYTDNTNISCADINAAGTKTLVENGLYSTATIILNRTTICP